VFIGNTFAGARIFRFWILITIKKLKNTNIIVEAMMPWCVRLHEYFAYMSFIKSGHFVQDVRLMAIGLASENNKKRRINE